jgi:hypothetical protein
LCFGGGSGGSVFYFSCLKNSIDFQTIRIENTTATTAIFDWFLSKKSGEIAPGIRSGKGSAGIF